MDREVKLGLWTAGVVAAVVILVVVVVAYGITPRSDVVEPAQAAPTTADSAPLEAAPQDVQKRFTKEDFDKYAYGRTKAQIRDEFGKPDTVEDSDDSWYYWHLPVYDATAGTHPTVILRFVGENGPNDSVVQVRYTSG